MSGLPTLVGDPDDDRLQLTNWVIRASVETIVDAIIEFCPRAPRFGSEVCEHKRTITQEEDELFHSRLGCLDCDTWLQPVRLKKP